MKEIKKIAVLTSGGDAPGMNAAVRAVARAAIARGIEVVGIYGGYRGMIDDDMITLTSRVVSNKIQLGGTFLYSDRCKEFETEEGMTKAIENLKKHEIDGVIVIGGDGTLRGGTDLSSRGVPVIGIPATIDNDFTASDNTIGYDTAMQSVIANVDRFRDTCESHARCNVIEVMGRDAGDIALNTAIASGAVALAIPEVDFNEEACLEKIIRLRREGKRSFIIIVSEGVDKWSCVLEKKINSETKAIAAVEGDKSLWVETKFCRLAHLVRGGNPSVADRFLATKMGVRAVEEILAGKSDLVIVEQKGEIVSCDIAYSQVLDKMYKGTLKDGMLDDYTPEQIEAMKATIAEKKRNIEEAYRMFNDLAN